MDFPFFELVRADVRERVRRRSFLVTLAGALYLGYAVIAGNVVMSYGQYRGVYNSAWIGTLVALSTSLFVSLIGFYIVKNTIDRDRVTGVGQILAATPLGRHAYLAAKWLSNFVIFGSIAVVQIVAAVVLQLLAGEGRLDLPALVAPSLFLTLPALLFIASLAVLFESARWLRGGFGNIFYFFAWAPFLVLPMELHIRWFDIFGLIAVDAELKNALVRQGTDFTGGFSLNAGPAGQFGELKTFVWNGVRWGGALLLQRAAWILYALVPVVIAAIFFDRFDAPAVPPRAERKRRLMSSAALFRPFDRWSPQRRISRLTLAELQLMFQGVPWWWFAVALTLVVLSLATPLASVQEIVLPLSWIWPVLIWSSLGVREDRFGTSQILFSAPKFLGSQFVALALAGTICSFLLGAGALVRFVIAGEGGALVSFLGGACFIPALAICLAVWSKTSRAFEAFYTMLWYVGPMNRVPAFDFTGASAVARDYGYGAGFFVLALLLLALGYAGRLRQLGFATASRRPGSP